LRTFLAVLLLVFALRASSAEFGHPGGPEPAGIDEVQATLRQDSYDMEILISFGTSKGGSAGHFALALRDGAPGDDLVYSANFYADRDPKHAQGFYTRDLIVRVPKREYLFKTASSLGDTASFGLDYGEVYKRSVVGVRVYGVPEGEKKALADYLVRMNDDFHRRASDTEYHHGEVKYDYLRLNCAKTIGSAFKYGAGYKDLDVTNPILRRTRVAAAANSNIPTEMALKLLKEFDARGYRLDAVLYRKYRGSTYVDPHEEEKIAFKDLPNRFPSVLSLDYRNDEGHYEDYDNLFAMYLLHDLARYAVRIDEASKRLEIDRTQAPKSYAQAAERAAANAEEDSRGFLGRLLFKPKGARIGEDAKTEAAAPAKSSPPSSQAAPAGE
jgi:hypothetical protein